MVKIPAEGGDVVTVMESPFSLGQTISTSIAMTADAESFVFEVRETKSDVWLVEDFDPDVP